MRHRCRPWRSGRSTSSRLPSFGGKRTMLQTARWRRRRKGWGARRRASAGTSPPWRAAPSPPRPGQSDPTDPKDSGPQRIHRRGTRAPVASPQRPPDGTRFAGRSPLCSHQCRVHAPGAAAPPRRRVLQHRKAGMPPRSAIASAGDSCRDPPARGKAPRKEQLPPPPQCPRRSSASEPCRPS
eukprot:scaffold36274_cov125-Isochrysis_galbana.AAC.19